MIRKLVVNRMMISFFNDVEVTADHPAIAAAQYFGTKASSPTTMCASTNR
ncbi:hypothetical protein [Verrucomicrobium spinosum]|nr:hypothetical protein [Verrucomicrobium spinosum]